MKKSVATFAILILNLLVIKAQIPDLQVPVSITTTNATSPLDPNLYTWTEQSNIEQGINIFLASPNSRKSSKAFVLLVDL